MRTLIFTFFMLSSAFLNPNIASSVEFGDKHKTYEFPVEVITKDNTGSPVANVPVFFDEKLAGHTGAAGMFKAILTERHRASLKLGVGKVDGYSLEAEQVTETDFPLLVDDPKSQDPKPERIRLKVRYKKVSQENLIWIKLKCSSDVSCVGIEIKSEGKVIATTNEFGIAHFIKSAVPGSRIELLIDTPAPTEEIIFAPNNPKYAFKSALTPGIYYITETFKNVKPKKKVKRAFRGKQSAKKAAKKKAARKKATKKKTTTKKAKKSGGGIDLW